MTDIPHLLSSSHTIAVVGLSDRPERDSYKVARYLKSRGYQIFPVNPNIKTVLGETAYSRLEDIPGPVDIVDIFRVSTEVPAIVDSAIRIGAKAVWMQFGVISEAGAKRAMDAGLEVVMDRCMMLEHRKLGLP
ncbi:MAG TPA: CoA-binding protein [Burkholderiales bacterium]|nr:CoA-binding protein [Burkholderiales bacterium]